MFERCLYFNTLALARAVNRIWTKAYSDFGLSPSHAYLLRLVLANPGMTQKEITQELKLEKSTVTRFVDALETKQFLKRSPSQDAREIAIFPTNKAKKIEAKLATTGDVLYQQMIDAMGKENLVGLVAQLKNSEKMLR